MHARRPWHEVKSVDPKHHVNTAPNKKDKQKQRFYFCYFCTQRMFESRQNVFSCHLQFGIQFMTWKNICTSNGMMCAKGKSNNFERCELKIWWKDPLSLFLFDVDACVKHECSVKTWNDLNSLYMEPIIQRLTKITFTLTWFSRTCSKRFLKAIGLDEATHAYGNVTSDIEFDPK